MTCPDVFWAPSAPNPTVWTIWFMVINAGRHGHHGSWSSQPTGLLLPHLSEVGYHSIPLSFLNSVLHLGVWQKCLLVNVVFYHVLYILFTCLILGHFDLVLQYSCNAI